MMLARPYAKACYELAVEQGKLQHWHQLLVALRDAAYDQIQDEQALNLVKLLAEHKRLDIIPDIVTAFEQIKAEAEHVLTVGITTAVILTDAEKDHIISELKEQLRCEVVSNFAVDDSLIAGAIVRLGEADLVDVSLKTMLSRLRTTF